MLHPFTPTHTYTPCHVQIDWKLLQQGSWEGTPYRLFEGSFRCVLRTRNCVGAEGVCVCLEVVGCVINTSNCKGGWDAQNMCVCAWVCCGSWFAFGSVEPCGRQEEAIVNCLQHQHHTFIAAIYPLTT